MEWVKELIDYGVIGFLLLMSVVALSVATERWIVYRRIRVDHFSNKKSLELRLSGKLLSSPPSAAMRPTSAFWGPSWGS